jgi:hypothetical protein
MSFRVYVAAPYADASGVRRVHALLRYLRLEPTSSWAEEAEGPEALDRLPLELVREIADRNDAALASSSAVLVLAREGAGREMFAEIRFALERRIPVVWVGPARPLTAYRVGVTRVDDLTEALATLCELAAAREPAPTALRDVFARIGAQVSS